MSTESRRENEQRMAVRDRMIEISILNFLESGEETAEVYADKRHLAQWNVSLYKKIGFRLRKLDEFDVKQKKGKVILTRKHKHETTKQDKTEETKMNVNLIKYPTEEDWMMCKKCTLITVGKKAVQPPTDEWKRKLLAANHSPIRTLNFCFELTDIPYWVSVHLVRHVHAVPFVKTQRNDRQDKYDRNTAPQNELVSMMWYMNAEELITIAHKRLCVQASKETREIVRMMCDLVVKNCPEFSGLLVPLCEYRNGLCTEMYPCGRFAK